MHGKAGESMDLYFGALPMFYLGYASERDNR